MHNTVYKHIFLFSLLADIGYLIASGHFKSKLTCGLLWKMDGESDRFFFKLQNNISLAWYWEKTEIAMFCFYAMYIAIKKIQKFSPDYSNNSLERINNYRMTEHEVTMKWGEQLKNIYISLEFS